MALINNLVIHVFALLLMLSACDKVDKKSKDLNDIPAFTPSEIVRFDHADSVYFSHLGYSSVVLNNGDILLPERDNTCLVVVNKDGDLKEVIRKGKGPGEILDVQYFTSDNDGRIYLYDQQNRKVVVFNSELELLEELVPPANRETAIVKVYPMEDSNFLFEMTSFAFLIYEDRDREMILSQYNPAKEDYGKEIFLKDQPYARNYINGEPAGAFAVPYADMQLVEYHPKNKSILTFDTRTNIIAELDVDFDTLNIIEVDLPKEKLSIAEIDTLKAGGRNDQWNSLKTHLPEYKAAANKMMYYDEMIWLETNLRSENKKWLVLNMKGEIEKIINLPSNSMLMHISDEHLGVRIDDTTFALFEMVN